MLDSKSTNDQSKSFVIYGPSFRKIHVERRGLEMKHVQHQLRGRSALDGSIRKLQHVDFAFLDMG